MQNINKINTPWSRFPAILDRFNMAVNYLKTIKIMKVNERPTSGRKSLRSSSKLGSWLRRFGLVFWGGVVVDSAVVWLWDAASLLLGEEGVTACLRAVFSAASISRITLYCKQTNNVKCLLVELPSKKYYFCELIITLSRPRHSPPQWGH